MTPKQKVIYNTALVFHEIEQLLALHKHGLTFAGDTISRSLVNELVLKGLACRIGGQYAVTEAGNKLAEEIRRVR